MTSTEPDETFDSIPWERLLADPADRRRRLVTGLSIGLAVLAISVSLTRTLWPVAEIATPSTQPSEGAVATVASAATVSVSSTQPLVSEADLLAVDHDDALRSAAGLAEWFLTEYFTVDAPGRWGVVAGSVLPTGIGGPPDGTRTFVDSVHVLSTEQTGSDRFLVTAVVRRLVDSDGSGFERVPPDRVAVEVIMGENGPVVGGPPRAVSGEAIDARSGSEWEEVPPPVVAAAIEQVASLGLAGVTQIGSEPVFGSRRSGGWSVMVMVTDPAGMTWPLTVSVTD